ncbi:hypothetical protein D9757_001771 [Collybiopsis confluens]|uniref:HMG box domain-containing protein n=1 Tax=Collybiopsis confluens TaxID=2823264 RepID=A0A8H5HY46_9AGAR|nr:hypothetical protein D9757_001771 [Collybiopsis confluens]
MSTPDPEADLSTSTPLPSEGDFMKDNLDISSGVLSSSLPYPDPSTLHISPERKKKSHARRQPAGHIPRPRNAFILFRCDFVRQKKVPDHVEANHRNISRIVGTVWTNMSASQKVPWIAMAEMEKKNHAKLYPGYKYNPGNESRGREMRIKKIQPPPAVNVISQREPLPLPWSSLPSFTPSALPQRRTSSCPPPGAFPVLSQAYFVQSRDEAVSPSFTRDDLARRPSRTIMYHSTVPLNPLTVNAPAHMAPQPAHPLQAPMLSDWWSTDPNKAAPLMSGPYSMVPPRDAPGWDSAPVRPDAWKVWAPELTARIQNTTTATGPGRDWNSGGPPTFTNPFPSMPSTPPNSGLSWNFDPSAVAAFGSIIGPGPMSVDGIHLEPTPFIDPTQTVLPSQGHNMDDLGNMLRARLSLTDREQLISYDPASRSREREYARSIRLAHEMQKPDGSPDFQADYLLPDEERLNLVRQESNNNATASSSNPEYILPPVPARMLTDDAISRLREGFDEEFLQMRMESMMHVWRKTPEIPQTERNEN